MQGDWTVACAGQRYQLDRQHEALSLVRRKVIVWTLRKGRVWLVSRGQRLKWRLLLLQFTYLLVVIARIVHRYSSARRWTWYAPREIFSIHGAVPA